MSTQDINKVELSAYPLAAQSLIEASAGTGKTYTIAELYNRLILGHGHAPLNCDQVLVVTFTKAATEELRGRLRARINATLYGLLQLQQGVPAEQGELKQLSDYLAELPAAHQEPLITRLQYNLALMDEASIFTIHSFCQRMLQRFAFDTGVMFSAEMSLDSDSFLRQACEDVWRQVAYGLNRQQSQALLSHYANPEALLKALDTRFKQPNLKVLPTSNTTDFAAAWQQLSRVFEEARAALAGYSEEDINELLLNGSLNGNSYRSGSVPLRTAAVFEYLRKPVSMLLPAYFNTYTQSHINSKVKKNCNAPEHPFFAVTERLIEQVQELSQFYAQGWFTQVQQRFFELLNKSSTLTPNDLMRLLHQALYSPQGEALAAHIRELYPFAMIDEFQDTDSLQYDIFNKIYPATAATDSAQEFGLIMIGDPKQAIYAFRGADIFTYIKAKQALPAQSIFTLDTNYRSHSQLVQGINTLYEQAQNPFVYNQEIPFQAVRSGQRQDQRAFSVANSPAQLPLQLFIDQQENTTARARIRAAEQCASKIAELLQGQAYLGENLVNASDITILVRSRKQARMMQQALQGQRINSVFLTHDSVFKTEEALALLRWLQAVAQPTDERALRVALAGSIQGLSGEQLAELLVNESAWEQALEQNEQYHQLWQKNGIMAAIMQLLENNQLAARLRQQHQGERRLTNLLHLGDLLQGASRTLQGHQALLRWFSERVLGEEHSGEEAQLRLESEADLVSIVTIHRSKGLQYPLVFLPFLWSDSNIPKYYAGIPYYDAKEQQVVLNLDDSDEVKEHKQQATQAENLRLLYVALTRAEQGCFVWLMNNTERGKPMAYRSALGALLNIEKDSSPSLATLQHQYGAQLYVGELPNWHTQKRPQDRPTELVIEAATLAPRRPSFWRVSSYSALAAAQPENAIEALVELKNDEGSLLEPAAYQLLEEQEPQLSQIEFDDKTLALTFTKGAQAGNCLHDILEHWDFCDETQLARLCQQQLHYYGLQHEEARLDELQAWLQAVVNTPLRTQQGDFLTLASLKPQARLSEMEFHLPITNLLTPQKLETLLGSQGRFQFHPLEGFLKGFIDLLFEHQGRYYVADYKSNFLGTRAEDYLGAQLEQSMFEHAYDLQAWIYTLALDALLRQRLGKQYRPEQHLGGVYYLFLRGMHRAEPDLGVYYQQPDLAALTQWRQTFFATATEAQA